MKHFLPVVLLLLLCDTAGARSDAAPLLVRLWKGVPPGSESYHKAERYEPRGTGQPNGWLTGVSQPVLSVYRPMDEQQTGAAIVICPGGGYAGQAIDKEGHDIARWFVERGVLAAVLPYRCGGGPHQQPVPLNDAQEALRLVRCQAADWKIDPQRIGIMGFSAGGHLAATAATKSTPGDPTSQSLLERQSSRPDFAVLVYPVISMREGVTHEGSRRNLLGNDPDEATLTAWSADEQVDAQTPPTLLIHSADDKSVPLENALRYEAACRRQGVQAELHIYPTGGHGFGMRATQGTVRDWPRVLESWLAEQNVFEPMSDSDQQ
ncbi:alpha/beta hydrolase [Botrimarina hoheduenensis]|uniref:Acetylxylan esterase n=1 Tax=Botrimarina hoheduenensis TaxID=2528000 RepID=A0A5C5WBM1_9BACT|nr:alpha/beta hydrolase [Botrimarina hoheduenensis]TWT47441.1 Acetylxylan esterase precursor [Botrimarina hoheduenensis]